MYESEKILLGSLHHCLLKVLTVPTGTVDLMRLFKDNHPLLAHIIQLYLQQLRPMNSLDVLPGYFLETPLRCRLSQVDIQNATQTPQNHSRGLRHHGQPRQAIRSWRRPSRSSNPYLLASILTDISTRTTSFPFLKAKK